MTNFKIIAIRTLEGCNKQIAKLLEPGELYSFYNEYQFAFDADTGDPHISFTPSIPMDFFHVSSDGRSLPVSISAVVGKNGSGKSSLLELFFAAIYNLSVEYGILQPSTRKGRLPYVKNLNLEIYYLVGGSIYQLRTVGKKQRGDAALLTITHYAEEANKRKFKIASVIEEPQSFLREYFFYTVAVNYSIYSLNSEQMGKWVKSLFHKNDGYQTPIVITPMRTFGNIDIRTENALVKQRLLFNLLEPVPEAWELADTLRQLGPGKIASLLALKINRRKINGTSSQSKALGRIPNGRDCLKTIYYSYTGQRLEDNQVALDQGIGYYILNKLVRICRNYRPYSRFYKSKEKRFDEIPEFADRLAADSSHITFKVKQALNFLRYRHIPYGLNEQEIGIEELSKVIVEIKAQAESEGRRIETIELIPPPVFDCRIIFEDKGDFEDLSSGEKQKIHGISSLVYHITNVNSVIRNKSRLPVSTTPIYKYQYLNLIFDEVELYFHPDLQRRYIHDLLSYIGKIAPTNIDHIKGINMLFSTHSPYLLSDIPSSNLLRLTEGMPESPGKDERTFGANIFDLLRQDFFMHNGFMGEWAKMKIQKTIQFLNIFELWRDYTTYRQKSTAFDSIENRMEGMEKELAQRMRQLKEDWVKMDNWNLENLIDSLQNEKSAHRSIINTIGEPVIRRKLESMYDSLFESEEKAAKVKQLETLARELEATITYQAHAIHKPK